MTVPDSKNTFSWLLSAIKGANRLKNEKKIAIGANVISALFRGAGWTFLVFFGRRFITFVSTIVLARLVGPEAFGIMAIALLVFNYVGAVSDAGVGMALVQIEQDPEHALKSAFTVSLAVGFLLTLVFFAAAPLMARFFQHEELTGILRLLSPIFLLNAFSNVQDGWLRRHFRYSARVLPQLLRATVKSVVSITLALSGLGVWSLVWGQLIGQIAGSVAYWKAAGRAPIFGFDRLICLALLSFGAQISVVTVLSVVGNTLDQLFIGRTMDATALGIYSIGTVLPEMVVLGICMTVSQVIFPAFSRVQGRTRLIRAGFLLTLRYVNILTFAASAGIALIATDFMAIAYSDQWQPAVPVIQILAVAAAIRSIAFNAGDVFKAMGRARLLVYLQILNIAISVPLMAVAVPYGLTGVATARLLASIVVVLITLVIARNLFQLSFAGILKTLRTPIIATMAMVATCLVQMDLMESAPIFARLSATILVGAITYLTVVRWLDPQLLRAAILRRDR